ncbi:MAG TPA: HAD family hydrolase [Candidatus Saccharimonadales bacterium]|jgi:histidinol-phosphate phosphatase family protein|nr:HAD family hydrolase [Candidatus Saccharimonadales bacterium]
MKAVFLDRDGTVIQEPPAERLRWIHDLRLFPDTIPALKLLQDSGYLLIIVTNQAGIGEGLITVEDFDRMEVQGLEALLAGNDIHIAKSYFCPHVPEDNCECRKPKPKMLLDAAREFDVDLAESYIIGDKQKDVEAGRRAGAKTILVDTGLRHVEKTAADFRAKDLLEAARYIVAQK